MKRKEVKVSLKGVEVDDGWINGKRHTQPDQAFSCQCGLFILGRRAACKCKVTRLTKERIRAREKRAMSEQQEMELSLLQKSAMASPIGTCRQRQSHGGH